MSEKLLSQIAIVDGRIAEWSCTHVDGTSIWPLAAGVVQSAWGGDGGRLNLTTSANVVTVTMASASDRLTGTGARTINIEGLDGQFKKINETIDLTAASVLTNSTFLRINRVSVTDAGSGRTNAGLITLSNDVEGEDMAFIRPDFGNSMDGYVTMAENERGYLINVVTAVGSTASVIPFLFKHKTNTTEIHHFFPAFGFINGGEGAHEFKCPLVLEPKETWELAGSTSTINTTVQLTIELCINQNFTA